VTRDASGIILAGGASRRMGRDKATLDFAGQTLLEVTAQSVAAVCKEVIIASGNRPVHGLRGLSPVWVPDAPGTAGPLAGLAAGMSAASFPVAVVVACDMPLLSEALLDHLLDSVGGCDAVVPMIGGVPQPLHAAYSRDCLPTVQALVRLGAASMRDLLSRLPVKYLGEARCLEIDPDGLSWFNMNTAEDLSLARRHWAARRGRLVAA
jgi:molybdopterin-guanine dinucleotide biosynthesis protein A